MNQQVPCGNSKQRRQQRRHGPNESSPPEAPIQKEPEGLSAKPKSKAKKSLESFWKYTGSTIVLLGAVVTILSFFPRIKTSDLTPMAPNDAFSYRIDVINDGLLSIFAVKSHLSPTEVRTKAGGEIVWARAGGGLVDQENCCVSMLLPGESYTFTTERLIQMPPEAVAEADVLVVVSYRPLLPLLRMKQCFGFHSYIDKNGSLNWFRLPAHCMFD